MGAANTQQLRCTLVFACLRGCAYVYKEMGGWSNVNKMMINNKNNIYCCTLIIPVMPIRLSATQSKFILREAGQKSTRERVTYS